MATGRKEKIALHIARMNFSRTLSGLLQDKVLTWIRKLRPFV